MKIVKAVPIDFTRVRAYYWDIIDNMQNVEYPTKWQKGVYPDDVSLMEFIQRGELFLLIVDGQIAGSMAINHATSDGYDKAEWQIDASENEVSVIHILGVRSQFQGKGYAKYLIQEAKRIAMENGQKVIRLDALEDNVPAQHLYTESGFSHRGTVELFYENTGRASFLLYECIL